MAGVSTRLQDQHHNLTAAVLSREEKKHQVSSRPQLQASPIPLLSQKIFSLISFLKL